jgi:hypothetical protein
MSADVSDRHRQTGRRLVVSAAALTAALVSACGSAPVQSTAPPTVSASASSAPGSASPSPSQTASTTISTAPTESAVLAVVQQTYPQTSAGVSGGCDAGPCPLTPRLQQEVEHLRSQTPSPSRTGDLCNFDLLTGNQGGLKTPVHATVQLLADRAEAVVSMKGQDQPIVTLVVVDVDGRALVDDILYDLQRNRSIYTLNCTNSIG